MMINNHPGTFALVQIHVGDGYATAWGNARSTFYGITGVPTAVFDGVTRAVGAYATVQQQYNWYNGIYNTRRGVPTDVKIEVGGRPVSGQTYKALARVSIEPGGTAKTMRIYMAQVLDYWPPSSPTYHRNGFKQAAATQDITLSPGQSQRIERNFTFDADSWSNQSNIRIIVWAQVPNSVWPAEVHQSAILSWPFPPMVGDMNCDDTFDAADIEPFFVALADPDGYSAAYPDCNVLNGDITNDGVVDGADIEPFFNLLAG